MTLYHDIEIPDTGRGITTYKGVKVFNVEDELLIEIIGYESETDRFYSVWVWKDADENGYVRGCVAYGNVSECVASNGSIFWPKIPVGERAGVGKVNSILHREDVEILLCPAGNYRVIEDRESHDIQSYLTDSVTLAILLSKFCEKRDRYAVLYDGRDMRNYSEFGFGDEIKKRERIAANNVRDVYMPKWYALPDWAELCRNPKGAGRPTLYSLRVAINSRDDWRIGKRETEENITHICSCGERFTSVEQAMDHMSNMRDRRDEVHRLTENKRYKIADILKDEDIDKVTENRIVVVQNSYRLFGPDKVRKIEEPKTDSVKKKKKSFGGYYTMAGAA